MEWWSARIGKGGDPIVLSIRLKVPDPTKRVLSDDLITQLSAFFSSGDRGPATLIVGGGETIEWQISEELQRGLKLCMQDGDVHGLKRLALATVTVDAVARTILGGFLPYNQDLAGWFNHKIWILLRPMVLQKVSVTLNALLSESSGRWFVTQDQRDLMYTDSADMVLGLLRDGKVVPTILEHALQDACRATWRMVADMERLERAKKTATATADIAPRTVEVTALTPLPDTEELDQEPGEWATPPVQTTKRSVGLGPRKRR